MVPGGGETDSLNINEADRSGGLSFQKKRKNPDSGSKSCLFLFILFLIGPVLVRIHPKQTQDQQVDSKVWV